MKKILALILAIVMAMTIVGCGKQGESLEDVQNTLEQTTKENEQLKKEVVDLEDQIKELTEPKFKEFELGKVIFSLPEDWILTSDEYDDSGYPYYAYWLYPDALKRELFMLYSEYNLNDFISSSNEETLKNYYKYVGSLVDEIELTDINLESGLPCILMEYEMNQSNGGVIYVKEYAIIGIENIHSFGFCSLYKMSKDDDLFINTINSVKSTGTPIAESKEEVPQDVETSSENTTEWRQFLADYEAWVDEYVVFMKKYAANPTDLTLLTSYADLMTEMVEWADKAENMQNDLSSSDLVEYMETMTSITNKLSSAISSLS